MSDISANSFDRKEIIEQEMALSRALDFRLSGVTAHHFLVHFIRAAETNPKMTAFAWYLAELALLDYDYVGVNPARLAAAVVNLARQTLLSPAAPASGSPAAVWTPTLQHYARCGGPDLRPIVIQLRNTHFRAWDSKYHAVRSKYLKAERYHVSESVTCIPEEALRF